ncbi:MAG: DegT/DnrJ/EryC1/StrS family aminotransferase, partial [Microbacterium sp.]
LAALGRAQLSRLDEMIFRRRVLRQRYKDLFAAVPGVSVFGADGDEHDNAWLSSILVDSSVTGWEPADLSAALAEDNIESRPLWKPMHMQPIFAGARGEINGASERLFQTGLTLPSGSVLGNEQVARVLGSINEFLAAR